MKFGIQQLMLGKALKNKKCASEVLSRMVKAGYNCIELNGFMIRKVPYIVKLLTDMAGMPTGNSNRLNWKELMEESSLEVIGIHEDLDTIEKKMDMVVEECRLFGTHYVIVTGMYQYDYDSLNELDSLARRLNEAGKALLDNGIHLLYHNHNTEFNRTDNGVSSYVYIVDNTDARYVNFEFDLYWASDAGVNVMSLLEALGDRLKLVHINDRQKSKRGKSITPIVKFDAAELGTGILDLDKYMSVIMRSSCEAVVLEQHKNWINKSPVDSFELSSLYLKNYK